MDEIFILCYEGNPLINVSLLSIIHIINNKWTAHTSNFHHEFTWSNVKVIVFT